MRIYYGDRVHYMATKASASEIRGIMDAIASVTEVMLKRIRVDLAGDETALSLQAFNLQNWDDATVNNQVMQTNHLLKLADLLGCTSVRSTASSVSLMARALAPLFKTAVARKLAVDNRKAWSWTLHPAWRARYCPKITWSDQCDLLVGFYLSLKVNTTTLERDLGELLSQLFAHSGPLSSSGSTIASIMEVNAEGPRCEEQLFFRTDGIAGQLHPTAFAELCAKLWLQHFGRRFRYAYKIKSTVQGPKSTVHAKGSLAAACSGRAKAAEKAAIDQNKVSFVPGLALPLARAQHLSGTRWESAAASTAAAALDNFEKHTQRKHDRIFDKNDVISVLFIAFPACATGLA